MNNMKVCYLELDTLSAPKEIAEATTELLPVKNKLLTTEREWYILQTSQSTVRKHSMTILIAKDKKEIPDSIGFDGKPRSMVRMYITRHIDKVAELFNESDILNAMLDMENEFYGYGPWISDRTVDAYIRDLTAMFEYGIRTV